MDAAARMVRVWDPFVRVFHWTLAAAFVVAWLTEDDAELLHVWAGYTAGGLIVLRLVWGVVGPRHARFASFLYPPAAVLGYLRDLLAFRAKRYLGHSPAGGAMVLALILGIAATVWTGLELYAAKENAGPLAALRAGAIVAEEPGTAPAAPVILVSRDEGGEDDHDRRGRGGGVWEALHEGLANLMMILVLLHIAGVALASIVHRENLARSMITGLKRAE